MCVIDKYTIIMVQIVLILINIQYNDRTRGLTVEILDYMDLRLKGPSLIRVKILEEKSHTIIEDIKFKVEVLAEEPSEAE